METGPSGYPPTPQALSQKQTPPTRARKQEVQAEFETPPQRSRVFSGKQAEARPGDKSPIQELPGGQATYYEMFMQLWMGWTAVFCILSFLSGVGVSYYVFQGTCDDVSDAATWNLIAAWRSLRAASMNPILAMLSPQTTQAAGVAAASIITLGTGLVGMGL